MRDLIVAREHVKFNMINSVVCMLYVIHDDAIKTIIASIFSTIID